MKRSLIFLSVALLLITLTISSCNNDLNNSNVSSVSSKSSVASENTSNVSNDVGDDVSDEISDVSDVTSEIDDTSSTISEVSEIKVEVSQPVVVVKYYNVTFDLNGGKLVSGQLKQSVENGKSPVSPTVKRDNYTFVGWDKTLSAFNKDTTLKAKWQLAVVENPASDFEILECIDSIIITKYKGTSSNIVIPSKIKNKPVTELGSECLYNSNVEIKSVILLDGLEKIGNHVFQGLSIETITLPSTLKTIGVAAFAECPNLKAITLPNSLVDIQHNAFVSTPSMNNTTDEFFIKDGVILKYNGNSSHVKVPSTVRLIASCVFFDNRENIKEITLPSSVKSISVFSLGGLPNLEKINFSEGLEYIAAGAISSCPKLQPLKFPKSLKYIGRLDAGEGRYHPFKYEEQEFVIFGDGVLRAYNGTDTTITIPDTVKVLDFLYVVNNQTVKLIIPESVKVLERIVIPYVQTPPSTMINLKEVYFPASITKISNDFYYDSVKLIKLYGYDKQVTFYVKKGSFMESVFKFYNLEYKYY